MLRLAAANGLSSPFALFDDRRIQTSGNLWSPYAVDALCQLSGI